MPDCPVMPSSTNQSAPRNNDYLGLPPLEQRHFDATYTTTVALFMACGGFDKFTLSVRTANGGSFRAGGHNIYMMVDRRRSFCTSEAWLEISTDGDPCY